MVGNKAVHLIWRGWGVKSIIQSFMPIQVIVRLLIAVLFNEVWTQLGGGGIEMSDGSWFAARQVSTALSATNAMQ